jgi:hypothetical protein
MEAAYRAITEQRMDQFRAAAAQHRRIERLTAGRRWAWLAAVAAARARSARRRAGRRDDFTLAG